MKTNKNSTQGIENLSFETLERIASDESVHAPASLGGKIEDALLCAELVSPGKGRAPFRKLLYGCCAALATATAAVSIAYYAESRQPADTFSDPQQAYEELQKTFGYISSEMGKSTEIIKSLNIK